MDSPVSIFLEDEELEKIDHLIEELSSKYRFVKEPEFLDRAGFYAQCLPSRLRRFLFDFKRTEPAQGFCTVSGFHAGSIPATPAHWKHETEGKGTNRPSMYLVLI